MIIHNNQLVNYITDNDFIHYGYGTFTTISKDTDEQLLSLHYQRLLNSSNYLNIEFSLDWPVFRTLIKQQQNDLQDNQAIKFINTLSGWYLTTRLFNQQSQVKLGVATYNHDSNNPYIYHKTGNYLPNIHELKMGQEHNYHDMIICNQNGFICETTVANIFWIKNNKLYTPDLSCGLLNGTIRQLICQNFSVSFVTNGQFSDLENADIVFLTNSLNKIMVVENYAQKLDSKLFKEISTILGR